MADELGASGITVNLVHPGVTVTERVGDLYARRAQREGRPVEEIEREVGQDNSIRRVVDAREVAYVAAFLASPKSVSITGEIFSVSGGSSRAVFA